MTLAETLLPRLSNWRPAGDGRHSLSESFLDAGWTVRLTADRADSLSCLVWELTLDRTSDAPAGLTLKAWAAGVANRVAGLLEDLKLIEVDDVRQEALLRSETPAARGTAVAYYEVKLHGLNRAVVRRYAASRTAGGRDQVAFALTHEVIAKLAGDVAG
jgi:hypothetical protein